MKPRVLFLARTRYRLPLTKTLQRRFDALAEVLDWRQFGTSLDGKTVRTDRFTLVRPFPFGMLEGAAFYAAFPARVVRELRAFRPDLVIVQGAQDTALTLLARRLARVGAPIVYDVHGDWRNDTRVYGSPLRRVLSPLTDRLAAHAVRHADGVRTVSGFTSGLVRELGVEPAATLPRLHGPRAVHVAARLPPLPDRPEALFVGVLERYKAIDVLAAAWPAGGGRASRSPASTSSAAARSRTLVASTSWPSAGRVCWTRQLSTEGVARALDAATLLVLPSRGEGMGRVIVEAFCRGRGVVGTDAGGIPDLVRDGVSGLLVPVDDADAPRRSPRARCSADRRAGRPISVRRRTRPSTALGGVTRGVRARIRELVDRVLRRPTAETR